MKTIRVDPNSGILLLIYSTLRTVCVGGLDYSGTVLLYSFYCKFFR
jgi:hypothetical protein